MHSYALRLPFEKESQALLLKHAKLRTSPGRDKNASGPALRWAVEWILQGVPYLLTKDEMTRQILPIRDQKSGYLSTQSC